ncbi:hypothetical protein SAMN04515668_2780 [Hymenobacter arizonensis]|uniref:Uncharacterized protein n=1 Tax=Hymenobacter arizonensis TaxID=1227077 RepID=A0A1I5Z7E6_HYMAR|nr:hypothetical protein SAMN04515668_2780 [Hymenobacter arizonensis]
MRKHRGLHRLSDAKRARLHEEDRPVEGITELKIYPAWLLIGLGIANEQALGMAPSYVR